MIERNGNDPDVSSAFLAKCKNTLIVVIIEMGIAFWDAPVANGAYIQRKGGLVDILKFEDHFPFLRPFLDSQIYVPLIVICDVRETSM